MIDAIEISFLGDMHIAYELYMENLPTKATDPLSK